MDRDGFVDPKSVELGKPLKEEKRVVALVNQEELDSLLRRLKESEIADLEVYEIRARKVERKGAS